MTLRRFATFVAVTACLLFFAIRYPEDSFQLVAGALVTFSTTSTLIFFGFVLVSMVLGFDRRPRQQVEQATPTHYRSLGDQFIT